MRSSIPWLAFTAVNLVLTLAIWFRVGPAESQQDPMVLRAQSIELVDARGQVRAQLHLGEDGSGNLRLRDAAGKVRVKLGTSVEGGTGLLLFDQSVETAVSIVANTSGTSLTLTGGDGKQRVITPD